MIRIGKKKQSTYLDRGKRVAHKLQTKTQAVSLLAYDISHCISEHSLISFYFFFKNLDRVSQALSKHCRAYFVLCNSGRYSQSYKYMHRHKHSFFAFRAYRKLRHDLWVFPAN